MEMNEHLMSSLENGFEALKTDATHLLLREGTPIIMHNFSLDMH